MRRLIIVTALLASIMVPWSAHADDPPAVVELKEGYRLRQVGACREALPHLLSSYRLDATPKAALNASSCEQRLGDLVTARTHASEGLALAERLNEAELAAVAREQLASIDKRVGHLILVRRDSSPVSVLLDGASVAALDGPVLVNPGTHSIVVRAEGHADRSLPLTLAEGATERVELLPGEPLASPSSSVAEPAPVSTPIATGESPRTSSTSSWDTRKTMALALGGVGVVAVLVGGIYGVNAITKNNDSNSNGRCDASGCDPTGTALRNEALSDATAADWLVGLGLAAVAGGVVLYLTAPGPSPSTARIQLAPAAGRSSAGFSLRGRW